MTNMEFGATTKLGMDGARLLIALIPGRTKWSTMEINVRYIMPTINIVIQAQSVLLDVK